MTSLMLSIVLSILPGNHHSDVISDTATPNTNIPIEYSFNSIKIYNNIMVYVVEGDKNEIIIRNDGIAGNLKFKVDNDVLVIKAKKNIFSGNNMFKLIVVVKDIRCITIMDDA